MNSFFDITNFNNLYNEYYPRFIRFAVGYVKEREIAEDFVSEAFTIFWENRRQFSSNDNPPAYILTIVKNKCLNHLQHIQVRMRSEKEMSLHAEWRLTMSINSLEACDPDFIFSKEIRQIMRTTLDKLPEKTRRAFILNRHRGLSYKEISEEMGISPKSVEFHISKALTQLRLSLKEFMLLPPTVLTLCLTLN